MRARAAPVHVPAYPVKVRDVSGAGDTVVAVLAVMLAVGADFEVGHARRQCRGGGRGRQARHRDGFAAELRARILPAASLAPEDKIVFDWSDARRAARRMARAGPAHRLHQRLLRPAASRPYQAAGAGARRLRPPGGRAQQRCIGARGSRAQDGRSRTSMPAPRCWPRSKRSISSWCSSRTRRSNSSARAPEGAGQGRRLPARPGGRPRHRRGAGRRGGAGRSRAGLQHHADRRTFALAQAAALTGTARLRAELARACETWFG